jgi:hypothetical protein
METADPILVADEILAVRPSVELDRPCSACSNTRRAPAVRSVRIAADAATADPQPGWRLGPRPDD